MKTLNHTGTKQWKVVTLMYLPCHSSLESLTKHGVTLLSQLASLESNKADCSSRQMYLCSYYMITISMQLLHLCGETNGDQTISSLSRSVVVVVVRMTPLLPA